MSSQEMCPNCKKDVPSSNYAMHTLHCARHVVLCPTCSEPVSKSEMDEHVAHFHSLSTECGLCKIKLAPADMEEHLKTLCQHRMLICSFCHLEFRAGEMDEHEHYCGSRTEQCELCGDFVMLKDFEKHMQMTLYHELMRRPCAEVFGYSPDTSRTSLSTSMSQPTLAPSSVRFTETEEERQQYDRLDALLAQSADLISGGARRRRRPTTATSSTPMSTTNPASTPSEEVSPLQTKDMEETLIQRKVKDEAKKKGCFDNSRNRSRGGNGSIVDNFLSNKIKYDDHMECPKSTSKKSLTASKVSSKVFSVPIEKERAMTKHSVHDQSVDVDSGYNETSLNQSDIIPCEFCDLPVPLMRLIMHQATCDRNPESITLSHSSSTPLLTAACPSQSSTVAENLLRDGEDLLGAERRRAVHADQLEVDGEVMRYNGSAEGSIVGKYLNRPLKSSRMTGKLPERRSKPLERLPQREPDVSRVGGGSAWDAGQREELRQMLSSLRKDPFDEDLEANDGKFFPCEFCGDPYPVEFIMRHQLSCDLNPSPVSAGDGFSYEQIRQRAAQNLQLGKAANTLMEPAQYYGRQ